VKRLDIGFAASAELLPTRQLSIAVLTILEEEGSTASSDSTIVLLEYLAYIGDVLSYHQERIANEAYLDSEWNEDGNAVRISLRVDRRPAMLLLISEQRAYVVVVGPETDDATVCFGDAIVGAQPQSGREDITAIYRRGAGEAGNLELRGLELKTAFGIVGAGGPQGSAQCFSVLRPQRRSC
jgi:hypothetical protein